MQPLHTVARFKKASEIHYLFELCRGSAIQIERMKAISSGSGPVPDRNAVTHTPHADHHAGVNRSSILDLATVMLTEP